jgi:DNA-binding transcriptional ArsR family regulator
MKNFIKVFLHRKIMKKLLVEKRKDKCWFKPIEIFENPANLLAALNPISMKILRLLAEEPLYPNELAKRLRMHEQKIYYHINKLREAGLITLVREEIRKGAVCKYYAPSSLAFGFEIGKSKEEIEIDEDAHIREFFYEFVKDGVFNGSIVVGAPFQHGPYLTSARDGHCAVQLAMFLGKLCELPKKFIVKLDTEVKAEHEEKRNMILVGGPITNIITASVNDRLKIRFMWKNGWKIFSEFSGKEYASEDISLIAKVSNPWDQSKVLLILAGLKFEGTKACILALTQFYKKVLKRYKKGKEFYCLIKRLDRDGDGKVDDVKVIESHSV